MTKACWLALPIVLALGACEGRPRTAPSNVSDLARQPRTGPALAVFDLSQGVPEQDSGGFFLSVRKQTFHELLREVAAVTKDGHVGAFVQLGSASLGLARAMELADMLAVLREKKPVFCHADGYTNATMYLAARGCTRIFLSPAGSVDAVGIAAQTVYMHKLLAEKLDLTIDFLQVGRFKGAEEPLTRDGPSDEARASLEGTLADMRASWLEGLREGRPDVAAGAVEDGPYSPEGAVAAKLVDAIGYADDAKDDAREAAGAVRDDFRFGTNTMGREGDLSDLVRSLAGEVESAPIALIRATGSISMSAGGGIFGSRGGITEHDLGHLLARVEHDDDIKALVLRIDSPGGSALASDLLWHALMRIRAKKPVVVSVGEMAASGGYYLASTGSVIFADATSIVGSIGVVGGKIGVGKALENVGVHAETFPAKRGDAKAAARASYESPLTAWDDATREKVRDSMKGIYELFLNRVVEGRAGKLPKEKLVESAEGRIFSGREGQARGLVDELGGLRAALAKARELAHVASDSRVMVLGTKGGLFDSIVGIGDEGAESHASSAAAKLGVRPGLVEMVGEIAPELVPFVTSVLPLMQGERTLVAVPFALTVK